jgi:pimeloyl-ACP methyl ester carboxylesterase
MPDTMSVDAAFALFTRPRRHERSDVERALLAEAERSVVRHGAEQLTLWSWGAGPLVLCVHGWEGRGSQFHSLVPPLRASGFRIVAMDCPAHGDSTGDTSSVPDFAAAVSVVGKEIGEVAALVGHSAGAAGGIYALARGLKVKCSAHLAAPSSFERGVDRFMTIVGLSNENRVEFRRRIEAFTGLPLGETNLAKLPLPRHPALLLHDPADKEVPFTEAELMAGAWPSATLQPIADVGHRRILQSEQAVNDTVQMIRANAL